MSSEVKEKSKLDPSEIVIAHFATLVRIDNGKPDYPVIIVLFVIPLLISILFLYLFDILSPNLVNILISTFSIFVGLLLNLLLLIYDLTKKFDEKEKNIKTKRKLLKEIFANISYCILTSITIIVFLLGSLIQISYLPSISAIIVYFLAGNFFLTILMVLKRIHILLYKQFDLSTQETST